MTRGQHTGHPAVHGDVNNKERLPSLEYTFNARASGIVALAALPLLLIALNDSWVFSAVGWLDPWLYTGYHLHLFDLVRAYPDVYYETRIPWNVLGWAVHAVAGPKTALYILRLLLFYASTFSLFFAIDLIFRNPLAGFISACLLGTNTWFLWAIGWDYVDGPSLACLLMSFWALAGAAHARRWRLAASLWGAATAALMTLYIMLVVLVPLEILVFVLLNRLAQRRSLLQAGAFGILGLVCAMLVMGLINWRLGSNFLFLLPQIAAISAVAANRYEYAHPWTDWIGSPWLLVPASAMLASAVLVIARGPRAIRHLLWPSAASMPEDQLRLFILCLACSGASAGFLIMEMINYYVLQMHYRADALLPFDFMAIGGFFALATTSSSCRNRAILAVLALGLCLAPWALSLTGMRLPALQGETASLLASLITTALSLFFSGPFTQYLWAITGAILLIAITTLRRSIPSTLTVALFSLFSIISAVWVASTNSLGAIGQLSFSSDTLARDRTLAILSASRLVAKYNGDARSQFWYNAKDQEGPIYMSLASTYLRHEVNENFPSLFNSEGVASPVIDGERLIILASHEDTVTAKANASLATRSMELSLIAREHVQTGIIQFDIVVADVVTKR